MKLSCLPVSLFPELISGEMSIGQWAQAAKDIGYDGMDISVLAFPNRTQRFLDQTRAALEHAGMDITMITTYPDFSSPDEAQREREYRYACADIALAGQLGSKYLRITAGQQYAETGGERGVSLAAQYFLRCARVARQMGVRLVYEDHAKPGAWDRPDILFDPALFLSMAKLLVGSEVRINFDTANIFGYGGDTLSIFREVFASVETIHVADMARKGECTYSEIGRGAAPIREVLTYAKQHGFDGWLCIEECSGLGLDGIARAHDTVREMWETA